MPYLPLRDYGAIGNRRSVALVGASGSIDWCCLPRFDSPSIFAAILDDAKGGRFQLVPRGPYTSRQAYLPDTNVLTTTFTTPTGEVVLTDAMPLVARGGRHPRPHLVRWLRCQRGRVSLRCLWQPAFNYARSQTRVSAHPGGAVAQGGGSRACLAASMPLSVRADRATAAFELTQGQETALAFHYGEGEPEPLEEGAVHRLVGETAAHWRHLAGAIPYAGAWRDQVLRSFLSLQLLVYEPTGAIVAAPTTSLPTQMGGRRNWDYRFCWVRDAVMALDACARLGYTRDFAPFIAWLEEFCRFSGDLIPPFRTIEFTGIPRERILEHLEGHRGSAPVRVGNAAGGQFQLDIYGEVLLALESFREAGGQITGPMWELAEDLVEMAYENRHRPDRGIWEPRGPRRHFVSSKVMCWAALDRGARLAQALGQAAPVEEWERVAAELKAEVLASGWSHRKHAFTQAYGSEAMDASNLLLPMVGFLPAGDPRIISTVERIAAELGADRLIRRYDPRLSDDGLEGTEGAFLSCSFWLAEALAQAGQAERAQQVFEETLSLGGPLGLFSEMADPASRELLGNYPQGLTHAHLIRAALALQANAAAPPPLPRR